MTGYVPRSLTQLADELRVSVNTLKSVLHRYCEEMQTTSRPKGGYTCAKLSKDDLELIKVLKVHSPSSLRTQTYFRLSLVSAEN